MQKFVALVALFLAMAIPAMAQMSGTNAVSVLSDNVTNASNVAWGLVVAIVTGLVAMSVFFKIGRKGGARA